MSDYQKPIGDRQPPEFDPIIIPHIEKDKRSKEEFEPRRSAILATLFSYLKRIISLLPSREKRRPSPQGGQHLFEDLASLREVLKILAATDVSQDPGYAQKLSELWHNLSDDCNFLAQFQKSPSPSLHKVNSLLFKIGTYPPGEERRLGFYLAEVAGKSWLPFPFIEILKQLHEEKKTLLSWIIEADEILGA